MTAGWPLDVRPISLEDLDNLGIDTGGTLYWAGRPMMMQQRLILTSRQKTLAVVVVVSVFIAGVAGCAAIVTAGLDLGRGFHVHDACHPGG